ncbi:hypothetical protein [Rhodococcoides fascians]|uniref:hypothetical protein n=1 Tax=Rhodococcoides fascians TaxID=1828 RepID=UPI0006894135|nr:hypothetical protein [Rhodococcus fascians]
MITTTARAFSGVLALASFVVGLLYAVSFLGAPQLVRRPLPPGQESFVVMIESWGPIWPALFGVAAASIVVAIVWPRRVPLVIVHVLGLFAWSFYGAIILVGAIFQVPPVPVLHGSVSMFIAALHIIAALVWLQEFGRVKTCQAHNGEVNV